MPIFSLVESLKALALKCTPVLVLVNNTDYYVPYIV